MSMSQIEKGALEGALRSKYFLKNTRKIILNINDLKIQLNNESF